MKTTRTRNLMAAALICALALVTTVAQAADTLPGPARQSILDFVQRVTTPGGKDFVPPAERIATFDDDSSGPSSRSISSSPSRSTV